MAPMPLDIPSMPYRGPCGCCGGPDARHRVCDVARGMWRAGDDLATIYKWFNRDYPAVELAMLITASGQAYSGWLFRTRNAALR